MTNMGHPRLEINGYKYGRRIYRQRTGVGIDRYWNCTKYGCGSTCIKDIDGTIYDRNNHNHPPPAADMGL